MKDIIGGNWLTEKAKNIFKEYFDSIAEEIGKLISESEKNFDRVSDEEFITGQLTSILNRYSESFKKEYHNRIKEALNGLYVDIRAWKNTNISESKIGADLGIILSVDTNNIELHKTILIQSKKGFIENGRIVYPELKKRGIQQAKKMLKITPSSFFMLYNPSEVVSLDIYNSLMKDHFVNKKGRISNRIIDKYFPNDYFYYSMRKRPELFPFLFSSEYMTDYIWDKLKSAYSGILILPANKISSLKSIDPSLEAALPGCISFSDFMVDFFLPSFVGDIRTQILYKAGANSSFIEKIITRYTAELSVSRG